MKLTGLNPQQVSESRAKHGDNILTPPPKIPVWKLLVEKCKNPVTRTLICSAAISLLISVAGQYAESIGVSVVMVLAITITKARRNNKPIVEKL